eukprot:scaffold313111_cov36-Tisochrysis_lutea.AAC.2
MVGAAAPCTRRIRPNSHCLCADPVETHPAALAQVESVEDIEAVYAELVANELELEGAAAPLEATGAAPHGRTANTAGANNAAIIGGIGGFISSKVAGLRSVAQKVAANRNNQSARKESSLEKVRQHKLHVCPLHGQSKTSREGDAWRSQTAD